MKDIEKELFLSINNLFEHVSLKDLKPSSSNLTKKYRTQRAKFFASDEERLSYIACRMMATFKAIQYALNQIKTICPKIKVQSVLDLGAGPATSVFSFFSIFKNLKKLHLVEKDEKMLFYGRSLLTFTNIGLSNIIFEKNDILKIKNYDFDAVILSYVANELKNFQIEKIINRWAKSKSKIIIFIEPGTMYGFKNIRWIRQKLIDDGFDLIAPCPNKLKCPMSRNDWCHFYVRVKRSKTHKYLKGAKLGYEDEKFSYVIATKEKVKLPKSRILRFINKSNKEITLPLCIDGKFIYEKISKKDENKYKIAKKLNWGDVFDV